MFTDRPHHLLRAVTLLLTCTAWLIPSLGCGYLPGGAAKASNSLARVRTLAGLSREFGEPFGIVIRDGLTFVSDGERNKIFKIDKAAVVSVFAENLNTPSQIAFAPNGDLIVADTGSHTVKRISPSGEISTLAGIENRSGFQNGPAPAAMFNGPIGVAVSSDGRVFVADTYNDRIRVIRDGKVSTLVGNALGPGDLPGKHVELDTPLGLAIWNDKLLVADSGNKKILVVEPDGGTWELAGGNGGSLIDGRLANAGFVSPTAIAVGPDQSIYIADGNAIRLIGRRSFPIIETISHHARGLADGRNRHSRFNRPSGLALDDNGNLLIADSDNQLIRVFTDAEVGSEITEETKTSLRYTAEEFRNLQPARWPYDPPGAKREIAGTLGEIRGEIGDKESPVWFHNGLDIAGGYGETARFLRSETVLDPAAAENFDTSRELIRMPTLGYIHIRLGRDQLDRPIGDGRFQFQYGVDGAMTSVRVPRGARFNAGEPIGTLNALNHVHLVAGRSGAEMNALDALILPGVSDSILPVIESAELYDENGAEIETQNAKARIKLTGKTRVVVRAYDRVDGNAERRRLGVYKLGYQVLHQDGSPVTEVLWNIQFDRMPSNEAVRFAYAEGSRSGATGETRFNYIVTNSVSGDGHGEGFLKVDSLEPETLYALRVFAADFFGNTASKDLNFEVIK